MQEIPPHVRPPDAGKPRPGVRPLDRVIPLKLFPRFSLRNDLTCHTDPRDFQDADVRVLSFPVMRAFAPPDFSHS